MIELTDEGGNKFLINPAAIVVVRRSRSLKPLKQDEPPRHSCSIFTNEGEAEQLARSRCPGLDVKKSAEPKLPRH